MSELNAQPDLTRVDDLWFPDGNLILRVENTLFRVLSSILGARSSVFQDMVAFPQPSQPDGDTVDGHTVVRLHDSATEVEVFLRAIFDSSFSMPPPSPVDFTAVIGVMRLAHKYDVQYLFRRALSHPSANPGSATYHYVPACSACSACSGCSEGYPICSALYYGLSYVVRAGSM
ncbi:BTB domain-containing protein [Mycena venus]|uniref:BTB domain-containing protein n=1 Tax=Mycena venus TaxID=2733690 RepID=A0A8H6Y2M5_9AGAR|nr:BTB domain-containing protein [Mycena venus]